MLNIPGIVCLSHVTRYLYLAAVFLTLNLERYTVTTKVETPKVRRRFKSSLVSTKFGYEGLFRTGYIVISAGFRSRLKDTRKNYHGTGYPNSLSFINAMVRT